MKICLDLDGVVYNYDKTARFMLREYRGHSSRGPMGRKSTSWDYIQQNCSKADWEWLHGEAVRLGLFRYGHVITGAQIGVRELRAAGHTVHIITHRIARAVPDTIAWLNLFQSESAGVILDGIHVFSDGEAKSSVLGDVLIDDKIENVTEWVGHGRHGILFDTPHNQGIHAGRRAYGWHDVVKRVEEINVHSQRHENDRRRYADLFEWKRPDKGERRLAETGSRIVERGEGTPKPVRPDVEPAYKGRREEARKRLEASLEGGLDSLGC